jgi:hypothetical protein
MSGYLGFLDSSISSTRTLIKLSPQSPSTDSWEKKPIIKTCYWTQSSDLIQSKNFSHKLYKSCVPSVSGSSKIACRRQDTCAQNSGHFLLSPTVRELATMQEGHVESQADPWLYVKSSLRSKYLSKLATALAFPRPSLRILRESSLSLLWTWY